LNTVFLVVTVKGRSLEGTNRFQFGDSQRQYLIMRIAVLKSIGSPPMETHAPMEMEMSTSMSKNGNASNKVGTPAIIAPSKSSMHQILRNGTVQLMAVYILVYVGVEVTIGGGFSIC
jgi:hypothetical protein